MRNKATLVNIDKSNLSDYPDGRIQNNTGAGNGTPVNEFVYGDIHEMMSKLLRLYGIVHNNLPDNESNGYQSIDALIALASKNDYILTITATGTTINLPTKVSKLKTGESFVGKVNFNKGSHTTVKGTLDNANKTASFDGSFLSGEYVRVIVEASTIRFVRMVDYTSLDAMTTGLNFLKAASGAQVIAGIINNLGVTPESFLEAFAEYVVGATSDNFLASISRNGLLSQADKIKLDNLGDTNLKNVGYFSGFDPGGGTIGQSYAVSGDIVSATMTDKSGGYSAVRVVFSNSMGGTSFYVRMICQSLGSRDIDVQTLVFVIISSNTIDIKAAETQGVNQNIRVHLEAVKI